MLNTLFKRLIVFVTVLTVVGILLERPAYGQPCLPPPAGIVSWWQAEDNSNDRIGSNDAAMLGDATFVAGKVGQAFSFDGAGDFAQVASPSSLPVGAAARTVEVWFKTPVDLTSQTESGIFQYGTASGGNMFGLITSGNAAGKLYFYGHSADLAGTTTLLPNTWYHGAVTYDGTTLKLYVNGQLENQAPMALNTIIDSNGITIGHRAGGAFWTGQIDEPTVYDQALSATEIAAIYAADGSGKCASECVTRPSGMVGWWPGSGNPYDVANGNDGSLVNGVTYSTGKVGQAFSLNQSNQQFVSLPDQSSQLLNNSAGTITAWVRPSAIGEFDMIAAFGSGADGETVGLGINGNVRIYHHTDPFDWQTSTPVDANTWTFLAYTWDGTTERLYKNGDFAESRPRNFNYVPGHGRIGFGFINDPSVFFPGLIDEVAIFNRTLGATEIASIYDAGSQGVCRACATLPNDLISWWPGENNAEDAAGGNFGVLIGGVGFAPGIVGNAFSFNGTSAVVQVPDNPTLDVTTQFTLGAWVRPSAIPNYPQAALVISKIGGLSNLNGFQMALTNNGVNNVIWCGFNEGGNNWPQHTVTGGNLPVGSWSYVSCTYDHNTLAVNQNGEQVGSTPVGPVTVADTTSNLRIGSDDVGQQFYYGLIDEPMIFGRALSVSELRSIFNAGSGGVCGQSIASPACAAQPAGLDSWWRAEGNLLDQRKAHHGVLLPGTSFVPGRSGKGLNFTGGGEGADMGTWFNLQTFTIEIWVKPGATQVQYANIVDNNHSTSPNRAWVLENLNTGTNFQWWSGDFGGQIGLVFDMAPDRWHHVVITRDSNRVTRGYLNRSFVGSFVSESDIPYDGSQNLRIGNWFQGNRAYNGIIDEVTVYDRALNEQEIAALYGAGAFGKCAAGNTNTDLDGDMSTDLTIFRPAGATGSEWWTLRSSNGSNWAAQFGDPTDKIVAEDFTGDGKTDVAIFRQSNSNWYILRSEDYSYYSFPFGTTGDIAVPADYDGDGIADPAVYRPSTGTWYIARSTGGLGQERFGFPTDKPVPADYDGDGRVDIAIYRPSNGQWWLNRSNEGLIVHTFGNDADYNVPGDFTGDGKADVAIFRPSDNNWYVLRSEDYTYYSFPFGAAGDIPAAGDYDGDAVFDAAVFRPSDGKWYLRRSTAGITIIPFGAAGDIPVPGAFIR